MLRLLNIELHKLRFNKSVRVISIVYFALITFLAFIVSIEFNIGDIKFRAADQGIFNFPYIWHLNAYIAAWLKIFLAIVIVSMVSNEYTYKTLKQNLIDGFSKKEFILSKFYTIILFAIVSTVFLFITSLILGLIFSDYKEIGIIFSGLEFIAAYFLKLVAFFSFCLFLGILVKRSAFALGFLFIWQIFEFIAYGVIRKWSGSKEITESITQFLPLHSMYDLIKEPFTRFNAVQSAATQLGENVNITTGVDWINVLTSLIYIVLFVYWSYVLLKRRDL
jgi:ABC-type transport system involved in multi-copper enzyme maturation permease subunit